MQLFKQRDRYFKNGNVHHAIPHDFLTTLYQILHIIVETLQECQREL